MKIGQLAAATSTKVETIRYYEAEGLLEAPPRTTGNYRDYGPRHQARLFFIRRGRDLGFTLDQVRDLLRFVDTPEADCSRVDAIATQHLKLIDAKITQLTQLRSELRDKLRKCGRGRIADCEIVSTLAG